MSLRSDSRLLKFIKQKEDYEEVRWIIKSQNLYNAVTLSNNTLLHYAAQAGNSRILEYLVGSGSQIDTQNFLGQTPLMIALDNDKNSVKILVKAGADIYKRNLSGISALQMIGSRVYRHSYDNLVVDFLYSVRQDSMNSKEWVAEKLMDAKWILPKVVLIRDVDLTKIMLQRGCDIGTVGNRRRTALHMAVIFSDPKNVKLLLDFNANIDVEDKFHRTPLSYVYQVSYHSQNDGRDDERLEILKLLVSRGEDLIRTSKRKTSGWPTIYHILRDGKREAVQWLLQNDVNLSSFIVSQNTLVHLLVENKNPGVIELFHGKFYDLNARNTMFDTPLIIAARRGIVHAVKFFIEQGADVDYARDNRNWTALAYAVLHSSSVNKEEVRECIQILLEHGANAQINIVSHYGHPDRTILDIEEDDDDDEGEGNFQLYEPILCHLALQEAQGILLTQLILNKIYSNDLFKTYFELGQQKLRVNIHQSITLFDVLTESEENLERYVRNQELYWKLKDIGCRLGKFYYFNTLLRKRVLKAARTAELKKEAGRVLCRIMNTDYERFPMVADEIISYLEQKDMRNLMDLSF